MISFGFESKCMYAQFVPSHILLIKLTFTHMLIYNLTTGLKRFKILILKKNQINN